MIKEFMLSHQAELDLYTQAIIKAHGQAHPEVNTVRDAYVKLVTKLASEQDDVTSEIETIRTVTKQYAIPADACPTMTKTYQLLAELDRLATTN